jgi:hypothetical protein
MLLIERITNAKYKNFHVVAKNILVMHRGPSVWQQKMGIIVWANSRAYHVRFQDDSMSLVYESCEILLNALSQMPGYEFYYIEIKP